MYPKYLKRIVAHYIRERTVTYPEAVHQPRDVIERFKFLELSDREEFITMHLDRGNRPICWDRVALGSLSEAHIYPREVVKTALLSNAASMILLHNHPSGKVEPSREDLALTGKLKEAAGLFGLKILDHMIIGSDGAYYSFSEHGQI